MEGGDGGQESKLACLAAAGVVRPAAAARAERRGDGVNGESGTEALGETRARVCSGVPAPRCPGVPAPRCAGCQLSGLTVGLCFAFTLYLSVRVFMAVFMYLRVHSMGLSA